MANTKDAQQREQYVRGVRTEVAIARTRAEVASLSGELVDKGLAGWGGGSVAARVPGADFFLVKPPAGAHDDLAPENILLCDLDGAVVEGTPGSERLPVAETGIHARVFGRLPHVGGIVFSQSPHALAFAAAGEGIPCLVASMAERLGGGIPLVEAPLDDAEAVADAVADALAESPAVLLRGLGLFIAEATAADAVRTALLVEDLAHVAVIARDLGARHPLSPDVVVRLHENHRRRTQQTTDDRR